MPAIPMGVMVSCRNKTPKTASSTTCSFQMVTATEISPYLNALERSRVETTWEKAARKE